MAREMTPQERAAAFVQAWMKQSTYTTESFINDVLEHDKQTRRAALLGAAEVAESELFNLMVLASRPGQSSAAWNIRNKLARLASEGE